MKKLFRKSERKAFGLHIFRSTVSPPPTSLPGVQNSCGKKGVQLLLVWVGAVLLTGLRPLPHWHQMRGIFWITWRLLGREKRLRRTLFLLLRCRQPQEQELRLPAMLSFCRPNIR